MHPRRPRVQFIVWALVALSVASFSFGFGLVSHATVTVSGSGITGNSAFDAFTVPGTPPVSSSSQLLELGPNAISNGSASGTFIGINPSSFSGDFLNFQVSSASVFKVDSSGNLTASTIQVASASLPGGATLTGSGGSVTLNGDFTVSSTLAAGFPQQLLGWTSYSYSPVFTHDSSSWDAGGLGAPSNVIYLKGEYWVCYGGYASSSLSSGQAFGCASGNSLGDLKAYSGNPVLTNSAPSWASTCIEGPMLYVEGGYVYMLFDGYSSTCDAEGDASIGIVSTTVANFPSGWSTLPASPMIPSTSSGNYNWIYRPDVVKWNGTYYLFANMGDSSNHVIIGYFTANNINGPWAYQGAAITQSQTWESGHELQEPKVWHDPSGLWIMSFGCDGGGVGFAVSTNLTSWSQLSANPVTLGINAAHGMWLPSVVRDSEGNYWMLGAMNDSAFYLQKATGLPAAFSPAIAGTTTGPGSPVFNTTVNSSGYWQLYDNIIGANGVIPAGGSPLLSATNVSGYPEFLVSNGPNSPTGLSNLGSTISVMTAGTKNAYLIAGQSNSNNVYVGWIYNASASAARAIIGTYGGSNPLELQDSGGNVGIGTSTPSTKLDVAGQVRTEPLPFASVPACSSSIEGATQAITDSATDTWGATITGTGSYHVLAYCDGTSWTVAAK